MMATATAPESVNLTGHQKAAALLIALGSERSGKVLRHLRDDVIERLTLEIFWMEKLPEDVRQAIIDEAYELATARSLIIKGGAEYAREILREAVGATKADEVFQRLAAAQRPQPFAFLRDADPQQLASFLQDEHPQTVALILSHLPPAQAATLLGGLAEGLQPEIARRIATMERTPPEVLLQVENLLKRKLSLLVSQEFSAAGGSEFLVKVLNNVGRGTEKAILEDLDESNPHLAEEIRQLMFVFENLAEVDDRSLQRILREVDGKDLAIALRGASADLKAKIFRNMSSRAAEMLREDLETSNPVRVRQVEEAQQRIVAVARRLEDAEEITIARGGSGSDAVI